jgi:hypothetical protein
MNTPPFKSVRRLELGGDVRWVLLLRLTGGREGYVTGHSLLALLWTAAHVRARDLLSAAIRALASGQDGAK